MLRALTTCLILTRISDEGYGGFILKHLNEVVCSEKFKDCSLLAGEYLDSFRKMLQNQSRSSRPEVFCRKDVLRYYAKLTGKHLWQGLFFNKVASLGLQLYSKLDSGTGVFL